MASLGMNAGNLASVATTAVFDEASVSADGKLSLESFTNWFMKHDDIMNSSSLNGAKAQDKTAETATGIETGSTGVKTSEPLAEKSNATATLFETGSTDAKTPEQLAEKSNATAGICLPVVVPAEPEIEAVMGLKQLSLLRSVFTTFDRNNDGVLNLREVIIGLRAHPECGPLLHLPVDLGNAASKESFLKRFQKMDVDGSKDITWTEFKAMAMISEEDYAGFIAQNPIPMVEYLSAQQQQMVVDMFQEWGTGVKDDNRLYISKEEFIGEMKGTVHGQNQGLAFVEIIGMEGDAQISLPEFVKFFDEFHGGDLTDDDFAEFIKGFNKKEEDDDEGL